MQILHGTWQPEFDHFALWGEDTAVPINVRKGKRGRLAAHPYPISTNDLLKILLKHSTDPQPGGRSITIWLPGIGKHPLPSPEAHSAGAPLPEGEPEMLGWVID